VSGGSLQREGLSPLEPFSRGYLRILVKPAREQAELWGGDRPLLNPIEKMLE
jgi:hypothetical protein